MTVAAPAQKITENFQPQAEVLTPEQTAKRDWLRQRFAKRPAPGAGTVRTREQFAKDIWGEVQKRIAARQK